MGGIKGEKRFKKLNYLVNCRCGSCNWDRKGKDLGRKMKKND